MIIENRKESMVTIGATPYVLQKTQWITGALNKSNGPRLCFGNQFPTDTCHSHRSQNHPLGLAGHPDSPWYGLWDAGEISKKPQGHSGFSPRGLDVRGSDIRGRLFWTVGFRTFRVLENGRYKNMTYCPPLDFAQNNNHQVQFSVFALSLSGSNKHSWTLCK